MGAFGVPPGLDAIDVDVVVAGGRGEAATYDAPDEEEADIAEKAQAAALKQYGDDGEEGSEGEEVGQVSGDEAMMGPKTTAAAKGGKKGKKVAFAPGEKTNAESEQGFDLHQ